MAKVFHQITLIKPGNIPSRVFDFLTDLEFDGQLSSGAVRLGNPDTGDWQITWLLDGPLTSADALDFLKTQAQNTNLQDPLELRPEDLEITEVADCNWLERSYRGFQPFTIGRFHLRGHHDEQMPVPEGFIGILIDAVTAFGSGEHPTTRGCLMLLDQLAQDGFSPGHILDLGTGSGILAIAAHKLWADAQLTAVDNDPESVRVAAEYAGYNNVPDGTRAGQMHCLLADTPAAANVSACGPFDLTIANILAGPLRELAPAIAETLAPNGTVILSGLLETQIDDVMSAYTPLGFSLVDRQVIGDWAALRLTR